MEKISEKIVIVTGGSSGIGREVCAALVSAGCKIYEFSRSGSSGNGIIHKTVDVCDESAVNKAAEEIISEEGRIDILVNCAGFGISGAVEFTSEESVKKQFDVNFNGIVRCVRAVLPYMRKAGRGKIVNVSSLAAATPIPFQTYYSATKAAINAYSYALANEVRPYGVKVCAVMPGDIATGFTAARKKSIEGDSEYGGRISRSVARMEKDEQTGMNPAKAGRYIAKIALKKNVKPVYAVGMLYKFFSILIRILPCRLANWILGIMYAS